MAELPQALTSTARRSGEEYAWPVDAFANALDVARANSLGCLGGQFQFLFSDAICEMYWLEADAADWRENECWFDYVIRSNKEVQQRFEQRLVSVDFDHEARKWSSVMPHDSQVTSALVFCAYFVAETETKRGRLS